MPDKLDLIEFLLYIAPGFLSRQLYLGFYPAKKTDTYHQIGWTVLYSLWIVTTIRGLDASFGFPLHSNAEGFPNVRFVFVLQIAGLAVGMLLVGIRQIRVSLASRFKSLSHLAPDPQSIWAKVNAVDNQDWAVVFLSDDSIYRGYISAFTFDPDAKDQDFLLSSAARVDESLNDKYDVNGSGVYLNTRNVKRIEFIH